MLQYSVVENHLYIIHRETHKTKCIKKIQWINKLGKSATGHN